LKNSKNACLISLLVVGFILSPQCWED